jgi:hypothetical protein
VATSISAAWILFIGCRGQVATPECLSVRFPEDGGNCQWRQLQYSFFVSVNLWQKLHTTSVVLIGWRLKSITHIKRNLYLFYLLFMHFHTSMPPIYTGLFLCVLFDREYGRNIFLRNVGLLRTTRRHNAEDHIIDFRSFLIQFACNDFSILTGLINFLILVLS